LRINFENHRYNAYMAVATSILHRTLRGAIGDLIFRQYNGKTIVSVRPAYKNETNTEARRQLRGRFRDATTYASNAMEDPKRKAYYQQKARQLKLPNAYTAAITDYLRKAKVVALTRSSFSAKKGDEVIIRLLKSAFKISQIKVILCSRHGEVLSEQILTSSDRVKHTFCFEFTDDFPHYDTLKIITDELGDHEYTIHKEDIKTGLLK
jgi:hypothetical protein